MTTDVTDLAQIIQTALGEIHAKNSSNEARQVAQRRLDEALASKNHLGVPACLHLLTGHGDSLGCHFALSTISKYISERGAVMNEAEWAGLKSGLLGLFQGAQNLPYFVMSKLIDVISNVAVRLWPSDWPELLPATIGTSNRWGICLFARICDALSEESLSVRCIAPERQLALRVGIASVAEQLAQACDQVARTPEGATTPVFQWVVELIKGLVISTKQSSFLIKYGLHQVVLSGFASIQDPNVKMLCVETLGNFIHFLNGQSGRTYTVPRATREQDLTLLEGIIKTCYQLLEPGSIRAYYDDEELRDCMRSFFDLLTDIRKTPNIFSYFPDLTPFSDILIRTASLHPSIHVQVAALGNVDAMLRAKHTPPSRDIMLLCFLACHDYYTDKLSGDSPIPPAALFPHLGDQKEIRKRHELCLSECEEEGLKPAEMVGKLKNAALLCVRHIATMPSANGPLMNFLRDILTEAIKPGVGVSKSYYPALLFTEAVATAITGEDAKRQDLSTIIDIISGSCPPGKEQDYLWFLSKAGAHISANCLQGVFDRLLKMDIAKTFPVQVAFIALCKNNPNSAMFVAGLHQALQAALDGESRSWAIGAILSASSHGGVGAADGFAMNVYQDVAAKINGASATSSCVEEFAKRCTPLFATLKAVLEVPLTRDVSVQIASGIASGILPMCWTKIAASPSVFEVGPNEYLSVLGAQFLQSASSTPANMNAAFQMYLALTQVAGLCLSIVPDDQGAALSSLVALFDPSWKLRPSLINILVSSTATPAASSRPLLLLRSVVPAAITSLEQAMRVCAADDFNTTSISRATASIVNVLLSALQITTDDEFVITEFSGAPKPTLSNRQVKAQMRTRNRFSAISEESSGSSTPQHIGHRIPRELLGEPEVALSVVAKCLTFRTDKALRRISQCIPTIITRWWNSVSHDAQMSARFVACIPELILKPIFVTLEMVRVKDPVTLSGGQLHSYAAERAVSGRKLASELVDHATISIHGALSVLWRFSSGQMGGSSADPFAVISAYPPLGMAVKMLLDATRAPASNESVLRVIGCAKEQSLESRATLKFVVESTTKDHASGNEEGAGDKTVVGATSRDLQVSRQLSGGAPADDGAPPGQLFDH
jgi:hypothetical protein